MCTNGQCPPFSAGLVLVAIYDALSQYAYVILFARMHLEAGLPTQEEMHRTKTKNDLVLGGHGRAAKLGACVNWVDWLRTSADKRMWSGRRAVVMVR